MDPLAEYFDGIKDAPVPARLMAETPPQAMLRRFTTNLAWAGAGVALALLVAALPTPADPVSASHTSRMLALREETR